jgi:hypothetical protein
MRVTDTQTLLKLWDAADEEPEAWTQTLSNSGEDVFTFDFDWRAPTTATTTKYHLDYVRVWSNDIEIDTCTTSEWEDPHVPTDIVAPAYTPSAFGSGHDEPTTWNYHQTYPGEVWDAGHNYSGGSTRGDMRRLPGIYLSCDFSTAVSDIGQRTFLSFKKPTIGTIAAYNSVRMQGFLGGVNTMGKLAPVYSDDAFLPCGWGNGSCEVYNLRIWRTNWGYTTHPDDPEVPVDEKELVYQVEGHSQLCPDFPTAPYFDIPLTWDPEGYVQIYVDIEDPQLATNVQSNVTTSWAGTVEQPAQMVWNVDLVEFSDTITVTSALVAGRATGFFEATLNNNGTGYAPVSHTPSYYFDVYFDGAKVSEGDHYTVDENMNIIPESGLSPLGVYATYVVR